MGQESIFFRVQWVRSHLHLGTESRVLDSGHGDGKPRRGITWGWGAGEGGRRREYFRETAREAPPGYCYWRGLRPKNGGKWNPRINRKAEPL